MKVHLYSCNVTRGATYAQEMANAIDSTVMGAPPGYGVRFDNGVPRAQVGPLTIPPLWAPFRAYHPSKPPDYMPQMLAL